MSTNKLCIQVHKTNDNVIIIINYAQLKNLECVVMKTNNQTKYKLQSKQLRN